MSWSEDTRWPTNVCTSAVREKNTVAFDKNLTTEFADDIKGHLADNRLLNKNKPEMNSVRSTW